MYYKITNTNGQDICIIAMKLTKVKSVQLVAILAIIERNRSICSIYSISLPLSE